MAASAAADRSSASLASSMSAPAVPDTYLSPERERVAVFLFFVGIPLIIFILAMAGAFSTRSAGEYFGFFGEDATTWLLCFGMALFLGFGLVYYRVLRRRDAEKARLDKELVLRKMKSKDDAQTARIKEFEAKQRDRERGILLGGLGMGANSSNNGNNTGSSDWNENGGWNDENWNSGGGGKDATAAEKRIRALEGRIKTLEGELADKNRRLSLKSDKEKNDEKDGVPTTKASVVGLRTAQNVEGARPLDEDESRGSRSMLDSSTDESQPEITLLMDTLEQRLTSLAERTDRDAVEGVEYDDKVLSLVEMVRSIADMHRPSGGKEAAGTGAGTAGTELVSLGGKSAEPGARDGAEDLL